MQQIPTETNKGRDIPPGNEQPLMRLEDHEVISKQTARKLRRLM
jgi:hypothetical protein